MTNKIIAEIKYKSPSHPNGFWGGGKDPLTLRQRVRQYEQGGACMISVPTQEELFGTSLKTLRKVVRLTHLPVLRKEFISTADDVIETKQHGATHQLLSASLGDLREMLLGCSSLGVNPIVECTNDAQIITAMRNGCNYIGVNNRTLSTQEIDLKRCQRLSHYIPEHYTFIAESGFMKPDDIYQTAINSRRQPDMYLIGTALMQTRHPKWLLQHFCDA